MKVTIQSRDKKALVALIIAVAAFFLISAVGLPLYDTLANAEETALEKETLLRKYRQVVARKGRYTGLIEQVRQQTSQAQAKLIRADNPSLAAVEFQGLVEAAVQKINIALIQRNVVANPQAKEPINELTMTLVFECRPQQLVSFLSEMRATPKAIRVATISMSPVQMAHEPPKNGQFSKNLRVTMTLAALVGSPSIGGKQ